MYKQTFLNVPFRLVLLVGDEIRNLIEMDGMDLKKKSNKNIKVL